MSRQGESKEPTLANIRGFWEAEAADWGDSPQVTIRDHCFRIHELHLLLSMLRRGTRLLDVGCGNGFGTLVLSARSAETVGVDYSDQMIARARRLLADAEYRANVMARYWPFPGLTTPRSELVTFRVGDVLEMELDEKPFDVLTGQRILINLPTHEHQMQALRVLRRHATPEALLILVEATVQGHRATDRYRQSLGIPPLEKYWHNNYVDEDRLEEWTSAGWQPLTRMSFDTYMLLSKVIYPAACGSEHCRFISGANTAAMEVANVFRTSHAVAEVGFPLLANLFTERVRHYDPAEAEALSHWLRRHGARLPDWTNLGHQRLFVATAIS